MTERYPDQPAQVANPFRSKYEGLSLIELHSLKVSAEASRAQFREDSSLYVRATSLIEALDELIAEQIVDVADDFMSNHLLKPSDKRAQADFDHTTIISAVPRMAPRVSLMDASIGDNFTVTPDTFDEDLDQVPDDSCTIAHNGEIVTLNARNFSPEDWLTVLERSAQDAEKVRTIEHSGALALQSERDLLQRAFAAGKNPDILRQEEAEERARQEAIRANEQSIATPPLSPTAPGDDDQSRSDIHLDDDVAGRLTKGVGAPKSHRNGVPLKEQLSIKKHPVRILGSVGLTALLVIGGVSLSHDGSRNPAVDANVNHPEINKDILKNINPDMTAKDLKLAQCWNAPLLSGSVSGEAQAAMLYTVNGITSGLRLQDTDPKTHQAIGAKHYLPISIDKTPVNIAVCAPDKLQAAIATMKDGIVTVNRADLTPNLNIAPAAGVKNVTVPPQKFEAAPTIGLTADVAAAITKSLTVAQNKADIATLSQADLATTITKDPISTTRLSASLDARMQILVQNQIDAFYKQQGRKAPTYKVAFTGSYVAPVAVNPTGLPDVTKRTEKMVKIVPGQTVIETLIFNDGITAGGN